MSGFVTTNYSDEQLVVMISLSPITHPHNLEMFSVEERGLAPRAILAAPSDAQARPWVETLDAVLQRRLLCRRCNAQEEQEQLSRRALQGRLLPNLLRYSFAGIQPGNQSIAVLIASASALQI